MRGRSVGIATALLILGVVGWRVLATRDVPPAKEVPVPPATEPGSDEDRSAPSRLPKPAEQPTTTAARPMRATGGDADAAGSELSSEALVAAFGSNDDFAVLQAADELTKRKDARALPKLVAFDIRSHAHAAPSVIDALGKLGAEADPAAQRTATQRLLDLLTQEHTRGAPESAGNVLALYEALGRTRDPRAASALESDLLDPNVTLAAKTVIVEALVRLHQTTSISALRTLRQQLEGMVTNDPLEEETRRELATAIDRALRAPF